MFDKIVLLPVFVVGPLLEELKPDWEIFLAPWQSLPTEQGSCFNTLSPQMEFQVT